MGHVRKPQATLFQHYVLPFDEELNELHDQIYKEMISYVRWQTSKPELEGLMEYPLYESICDAAFLILSGVLECHFVDYLPKYEKEGLLITLN